MASAEGQVLGEIIKIIASSRAQTADQEGALQSIVQLIARYQSVSLPELLAETAKHIAELARTLDKPTPELRFIQHQELRFSAQEASFLIDVINHLLRNTLDHGLESAPDRIKAGKAEHGHIAIESGQDADHLILRYRDDGAGLNLARIRAIGLKRGLITEAVRDPQKIAALIFEPRFSTAETTTSISGRGIGMDAVKAILEERSGSIRIQFLDSGDALGCRPFEFVISIPGARAGLWQDHPGPRSSKTPIASIA